MGKVKLVIDKPYYVGFSVLELSNLHMYRVHYEYILPKYGPKATLLLSDTDSLMYEIETEDAYQKMFNFRERFDLSSYPRAREFYDPLNNKVCVILFTAFFVLILCYSMSFCSLSFRCYCFLPLEFIGKFKDAPLGNL